MCKFAYTMMWPLRFPSKLKNSLFSLSSFIFECFVYVNRLVGFIALAWPVSREIVRNTRALTQITNRMTTAFDDEHRVQCYDIFLFLVPISISLKYLLWDCSPESVDSLAIAWEQFRRLQAAHKHTHARTNNKIMIIERTCREHTDELVQ